MEFVACCIMREEGDSLVSDSCWEGIYMSRQCEGGHLPVMKVLNLGGCGGRWGSGVW